MNRPRLLGLTGSIGMGKSTTAALFREKGVPVWDADAVVHGLYAEGGAAVKPIGDLCPEAIRHGAVDRDALKAWIAREPEALMRIEAVVHPLVAADRQAFIARHREARLLVLDIPLLFETGAEKWLDAVLVVTAPPGVQRARVLERPGMTGAQLDAILARQMPDAEKRARADHVIETLTLDQARAGVAALIDKLGTANA
ncbi:dephospho-CoA kinase [Rhodovulum sp. MB263]|uniref:dephospho-CoA kinase n=1 Tax=Rhodovulum sp. (strain MB263) TaxID=308754 RepID=UPI0009B7461D|nr:dephospho-CoA kinase [Rhodovulum sp. MB263]ARC87197.1 dephospho-CoA kinase [Rhodovulum sp. MB263]